MHSGSVKKSKYLFNLPPMPKIDFSDKTNKILAVLGVIFIAGLLYSYSSYSSYQSWMDIAVQDVETYYADENYMDYVQGDLDVASDYENNMYTGGFVTVASAIAAAVVYKKRKA
jgi:hypothetical protein